MEMAELESLPLSQPVQRQRQKVHILHGHDFETIKELVSEITADHHVSFDSITWEWELPAVPSSDLEREVVLICMNPKTQDTGNFEHVYASTYQEYLEGSRWANFIMETLDILTGAELDSAHGGTFYSYTYIIGGISAC
jgi:hypothetical protein